MLPEPQKEKFFDFFDTTVENEFFNKKETIMIQMASALAIGCLPWIEHFFGVAKDSGFSDNEIGTLQSIVMAVSAGRVRAQFREVREKIGYE